MDSKCPIDTTTLSAMQINGAYVHSCEKCAGAWLPGTSAGDLFSKLPGGMAQSEKFNASVQSDGRDSPLQCLECGTALRRLKKRSVEIDACRECGGIWFDGGELQRFQQSGGKAARTAALVAGGAALGAAGVAGAVALNAGQLPTQGNSLASTVGDVAIEGALDVAGEVVGDVFSAILGALFE